MKRIILIALGLLMILALCACNAASPAPSARPGAGGEAAAPEASAESPDESEAPQAKAGITVQPPSGWAPVAGTVLPAQYMKNTASFMAKEESFGGKTLDAVVGEAREAFGGAFDGIQYEGEPQTVTVDGKDAAKLVFTCSVSGIKMKYEYVYLFAGGSVWALTFGDMAETFDSLQGDYDKILESIRFQ